MEEPEGRGGWLGPEQWLADEHSGGGGQRPPPAPGMASMAQSFGMIRGPFQPLTVKIAQTMDSDRSTSQPCICHLLFDQLKVSGCGGKRVGYMVNLLYMSLR